MITVIDYGMCNTGSILNMLKKIGAEAVASSSPPEIEKADKLILPGVGAFDKAVTVLGDSGLIPALNKRVIDDEVPILGICLGMHLMAKGSEEGKLEGLGWFDADVKRFAFDDNVAKLKTPHMGWNGVRAKRRDSLFEGLEEEARFYFVHSYHIVCRDDRDVLAETSHGYVFTSAVRKGNVAGTQFHPEKSHRFGLTLLRNFVEQF